MTDDIITSLAKHGAGIFIRDRNTWSRVEQADGWRIFREPVEVWFQGGNLDESNVLEVCELLKGLPEIKKIRFLGTAISEPLGFQVKLACPKAEMEMTHTTRKSRLPRVPLGT